MFLGDLSIEQIEGKLGIVLSDEIKDMFNRTRQRPVNIDLEPDKWHGFDIPFCIVCGSREFAEKVREILTPYASKMKCQIQIRFPLNESEEAQ